MFTEAESPFCVTMFTKAEDIFWGKKKGEGREMGYKEKRELKSGERGRERQMERDNRGYKN